MCNVLGYILITAAVLSLVLVSPAYFAFIETYNISLLVVFLPTDAAIFILVNYLTMPLSWLFFCMSAMLLLPPKDISMRKTTLYAVIMICASILLISTTVTTALLYTYSRNRVNSSLIQSIQQSTSGSKNQERWNITQARMKCCGANGPADWTSAGYANTPCGGYALSCIQAIDNSYFLVWGMSVLGLAAACFIGSKAKFGFNVIDSAMLRWGKIKRKLNAA